MAETDLDTLLQRQIKDGKEFDNLIPYTTCERIGGGIGNTDYSISKIKEVALDFSYQTEKIAKVLRGGSLERDVAAIKGFIFDHFQYKADKNDQMMRAPSCSWFDRFTGIDCKSYSIFASSLLLNMGYIHFIRKIRQQAPEGMSTERKLNFESGFSHVYVIVPVDQKKGTLSQGYYCIDGTIGIDNELNFLEAKDIIMDFPHHVLLGSVVRKDGYSYQDIPSLNGVSLSSLKELSKSFKLNDLKGVWGKISCLGGSSLDANGLKVYLTNIDKFYQDWVYRFNSSIGADNAELTSYLIAEFRGLTAVFLDASKRNRKKTNWNGCTGPNIDIATNAFLFYNDVVGGVLTAYVEEYFNKVSGSFSQSNSFSSANAEKTYGFRHLNVDPASTSVQPNQLYVPDLKVNIPAFDLPKYVVDQTNAGQPINVDTVLNLLETAGNIVKTVAPGSSNPGSSNSGTKPGIKPGTGTFQLIGTTKPTTKMAGLGTVAGVGILVLAIAVATTKMKDNPITPATNRNRNTKTVKK